ncbi:MAG: PTS sugar transporter subunit IIA [Breznakia sp.]
MNIRSYFIKDRVKNKFDVFNRLVVYLEKQQMITNEHQVMRGLIDREEQGSTGMTKGIAIPHVNSVYVVKPTIMYIRLDHGIDWESIDKEPVHHIFALLSTKNIKEQTHLEMLSKIAELLMDNEFILSIKNASSEIEVVKIINNDLGGFK